MPFAVRCAAKGCDARLHMDPLDSRCAHDPESLFREARWGRGPAGRVCPRHAAEVAAEAGKPAGDGRGRYTGLERGGGR